MLQTVQIFLALDGVVLMLWRIDQDKVGFFPNLSMQDQTYSERRVAVRRWGFLKSCICWLYLSLKVLPVDPMYTLYSLLQWASTLYTTLRAVQFPLSGHAALSLQLHDRAGGSLLRLVWVGTSGAGRTCTLSTVLRLLAIRMLRRREALIKGGWTGAGGVVGMLVALNNMPRCTSAAWG